MNDHEALTPEQLNLATSRSLPADVPLDADTSLLREGWLALGHAAESAADGFDSQALLLRLQAELLAPPQPVEIKQQQSSWWPAILGAALALSMLVALLRSLPEGASPSQVSNGSAQTKDLAAVAAWSDPLDDEIDRAAQRVQSLVVQGNAIDATLSGLSQQLESMSDDLEHQSL